MRAALLALIVLLLVGAGLFLLLGAPTERGRGDAGREAAPRTAPAGSELSSAAGPVDAPRTEAARTAEPIADRDAAPKGSPAVSEAEGEPNRALGVRVIDIGGTPVAGVPVLLVFQEGGTSLQLESSTRKGGLAIFQHVGRGWPHAIESMKGRVSVAGLFQQSVAREFEARDWPTEPIELVVPATGSVVVEVRDASGKPLAPIQGVTLEVEGQKSSGTYLWGPSVLQCVARTEEGIARFECVEPGLDLIARADCRPDHGTAEVRFQGPTRVGQEVRARLTPSDDGTWIVVRLLSPTGTPLADASVICAWGRRVAGARTYTGGDDRRTDSSGRLRLGLRQTWSEGATVTLEVEHSHTTKELWKGELDLSREFPPGNTLAGDLRLLPEVLLVAGRVIDEDGQPVRAFQAWIEGDYSGTGSSWNRFSSAIVGSEGSFASHGKAPTDSLRLVIVPEGYVTPDPVLFVPGTDNLEIVLHRGGGLEGTLKPVQGLVFGDLFVAVERDGEDAGGDCAIEADGIFRILGAPTGAVDVVFGTQAIDEALLRIPGIGVVRGEQKRDPRLQDVDLSPYLRCVRVGVRLSDGTPAQSGWVRPLRRLDRDAPAFLIEGGQARVLTRADPIDLEVNVPGHRIAVLEGVTHDREVALEAGFEVDLVLPDHVRMPPAGTSLEIGLGLLSTQWPRPDSLRLMRGGHQAGWWSGTFGDGSHAFSIERGVRFSIQEFGTFDVSFYLMSGSPEGGRIAFAVDGTTDLEIGPGDAGRTILVEPDPEAYEQRLSAR